MSKKGYLTAAEYKALRELLGFSQQEAAEFHNMQNARTIRRWERGDSWVSKIASDKICALAEKVNWTIEQVVDSLLKYDPSQAEAVFIVYPGETHKNFLPDTQGLPTSVHRSMIGRIYSILHLKGYEVGIVEFNAQDYISFLGRKGLTDSQSTRALWATDYRSRLLASELEEDANKH